MRRKLYFLLLLICMIMMTILHDPPEQFPVVAAADISELQPLPEGCGGVTPPGEQAPSCCISGFVYGDGQPLANAEIRIDASDGSSITTRTHIYSGNETRPYYRLSLNTDSFNSNPGDTITVTARFGDHERHLSYVVQPDGQQLDLVLASNPQHDYLFQGHIGNTSSLISPRAVAYDSQDHMYVLDTTTSRVKVFDSTGSLLNEWGSTGTQPGQLTQPGGIAIGPGDIVYIVDTQNHRVQTFSAAGSWISSLGSQGSADGQLNYPEAVAVDPAGAIYVADTDNNRIQKFSANGTWLASWGSQGSAAGQFDGPTGIALDQAHNIYVTDRFNHRIQQLDKTGKLLTSWGSYGSAAGQLIEPRGIAIDSNGNVYVADSGNDRIQKFGSNGTWLSSWGASGIAEGLFAAIYGLAVSSHKAILVADAGNQRVELFRPMTTTRPIATISKLSAEQLAADETLTAIGMGADSDSTEPVSAYRWTSDRQGVLAETASISISASKLLSGNHQLSFAVRDDQGEWSDAVSTTIMVNKTETTPTASPTATTSPTATANPTPDRKYKVFLPAIGD